VKPAERMKTYWIEGVPVQIRSDMPQGYFEWIEQDIQERKLQKSYDEGHRHGRRGY